MSKRVSALIVFLTLVSLVFIHECLAWNDDVTHKQLSVYAVESSSLETINGDYLSNIGFDKGIDEYIFWNGQKKQVYKWIEQGAELEDAGGYIGAVLGKARYKNHFHDPTSDWNNAGLSNIQNGLSSILWAQDAETQVNFEGKDWSWDKIRQVYHWALIAEADALRQVNFAQVFRGLGHQMHLIQDMAQPAHVRNDAHPIDGLGWTTGLETWTKKNLQEVNALREFAPAPAFPEVNLNIDVNHDGISYAPVTQFIDTIQSATVIVPSTGLDQGLAEYTNANFASDDTIFTDSFSQDDKHYFPYPTYSSESYLMYEVDIGTHFKRIYIEKKGDGEHIKHFATVGPLYKHLDFDPVLQRNQLKLDPACHYDYAKLLIPRAVGYSAALLNYFFRGDISIELSFLTDPGYVIANNTREAMDGMFELYYDDVNDKRRFVWGQNLYIPGYGKSSNINFPTPVFPKEEGKYILVFNGKLGHEDNAVVGRVVELPSMDDRHFLVFRDDDHNLVRTGADDDESGYYNTNSVLMLTAATRSVPSDWGYPNNKQYYWKFKKVSGQAKLVQEGVEPGERRLYHKAIVNVGGQSFTVNRVERHFRGNFVTHSEDQIYNSPPYVQHTDNQSHDTYWNDGYDAVEGECDSSIILMQSWWWPGDIDNAIKIIGNPDWAYGHVSRNPNFTGDPTYNAFPASLWLGNMDDPWFASQIEMPENDFWRVLSTAENSAEMIELYSNHHQMYPPASF